MIQLVKESENVEKRRETAPSKRRALDTERTRPCLILAFMHILGGWGSTVRFLILVGGCAAVLGVSVWLLGLNISFGPVRIGQQ